MNRNARLALIRGWLHDLVCHSGCVDAQRADHARRTQHATARSLEAALSATAALPDEAPRVLHDHLCLAWLRSAQRPELRSCRHASGQLDLLAYENAVDGLIARLSDAGA